MVQDRPRKKDAHYLRARAAEIRRVAEGMHSVETRRIMLILADGYDRLAQHADASSEPEDKPE